MVGRAGAAAEAGHAATASPRAVSDRLHDDGWARAQERRRRLAEAEAAARQQAPFQPATNASSPVGKPHSPATRARAARTDDMPRSPLDARVSPTRRGAPFSAQPRMSSAPTPANSPVLAVAATPSPAALLQQVGELNEEFQRAAEAEPNAPLRAGPQQHTEQQQADNTRTTNGQQTEQQQRQLAFYARRKVEKEAAAAPGAEAQQHTGSPQVERGSDSGVFDRLHGLARHWRSLGEAADEPVERGSDGERGAGKTSDPAHAKRLAAPFAHKQAGAKGERVPLTMGEALVRHINGVHSRGGIDSPTSPNSRTDRSPGGARGPREPRELALLRVELAELRLPELRKRAASVGVGADAIEAARDDDEPKAALTELLVQAWACLHKQAVAGDGATSPAESRTPEKETEKRRALRESLDRHYRNANASPSPRVSGGGDSPWDAPPELGRSPHPDASVQQGSLVDVHQPDGARSPSLAASFRRSGDVAVAAATVRRDSWPLLTDAKCFEEIRHLPIYFGQVAAAAEPASRAELKAELKAQGLDATGTSEVLLSSAVNVIFTPLPACFVWIITN
jgi:hypothetical protein